MNDFSDFNKEDYEFVFKIVIIGKTKTNIVINKQGNPVLAKHSFLIVSPMINLLLNHVQLQVLNLALRK